MNCINNSFWYSQSTNEFKGHQCLKLCFIVYHVLWLNPKNEFYHWYFQKNIQSAFFCKINYWHGSKFLFIYGLLGCAVCPIFVQQGRRGDYYVHVNDRNFSKVIPFKSRRANLQTCTADFKGGSSQNIRRTYMTQYNVFMWASWRLKSPATQLLNSLYKL